MTAARRCIFCSIIAGEAPAHFVMPVEREGHCVAFLDARPLFPGHVLVVPRAHRETMIDLSHAELTALYADAQKLCGAVERALGADGSFVAMNNRVSQSVAHAHVHVVPRKRGDGLRGFFWPRHKYASDEEAAGIAKLLREATAT